MTGKLYLIPSPISEVSVFETIPDYVFTIIRSLDFFITEEIRTARRFFSFIKIGKPIDGITFFELNKHTDRSTISSFFEPVFQGHDIGLLSEAGLPCIADPGAEVVLFAHKNNIQVVPLAGPSSILLALIASGLNGQRFAFNGYLPVSRNERTKEIRRLEKISSTEKQSQIFMEAPFRNNQLLADILETCHPATLLSVSCQISAKDEWIKTKTVAQWKNDVLPDLHKKPAVFIIQYYC